MQFFHSWKVFCGCAVSFWSLIVTVVLLLMITSSASSVTVKKHSTRRAKRIALGEPLPSLDTYRMYHFVQLRRSWACVTDQTDHEDALIRCQEDYHKCGGTLIHPEFVLTAAHCLMYFEAVVYMKGEQRDDWVKDTLDSIYYSIAEAWAKLKHAVIGIFILPKPRHTVYTDWALLMGSHNWYNMKQKRHVVKVFPHRVYPTDVFTEKDEYDLQLGLNSWHDIALLQACLPFNIKPGEVQVAPMLMTVEGLREQYERIVRIGAVCLYVGFGRQDNDDEEAKQSGHPQFESNLMLHTWRHSLCYSSCNYGQLIHPSTEHTCALCSRSHGPKEGTPELGDSGSPVTCDGKFVATFTKSALQVARNVSRAASYPVHCIFNSVAPDRLNYYKTVPHGPDYHPLNGTRLRRLPLPPE